MPVPLHIHSCYSFLEGLPAPDDLARAAASSGYRALALTDHRWLTGAVLFDRACRDAGIRPLFGLEIDLLLPYRLSAPTEHVSRGQSGALVLLAENRAGWRSLCRISSRLFASDRPGLALEEVAPLTEGLVCLTGGARGAAACMLEGQRSEEDTERFVGQLADVFAGRCYVEIDRAGGPKAHEAALGGIAQRLGLPLAATSPAWMLRSNQAPLQKTVTAIRENRRVSSLPAELAAPKGSHFLTLAQLEAAFSDLPEALAATDEIAERCAFRLPVGEANYPKAPLPDGVGEIDLLRRKAEEGVKRYYGEMTPEIDRRLRQELEVIAARGFAPIFLIAEEILSYARSAGIPTASRGSASSSLVAHCLGITTPDPLANDLYFERFLNPARATPPDIDTDVCSRRRDDLLRHVFATCGVEKTAMVGTVNTFRARSALQDVAKAHGLKPQEVRSLAAGLPHFFSPRAPSDSAEDPEWGPFTALVKQHPQHRALFKQARDLLGLPRHLSVHPGGVVIAPGPMEDYLPLAGPDSKGLPVAQMELDSVEALGLIKLDLLGVRGLTVLGDLASAVHSWRRTEFRGPLDVLEAIPEDDAETVALVSSARTIGCFSIESPGMRATIKEIHARCPADLLAALALYRPGPINGGLRDSFVRRHNRLEPVTHLHPALSDLLRETYGVILYQEQVLRIAHELGGFSLAEADLLRRAMSHFDPGKQMQALKEKFIDGAAALHQVPAATAARIWEMMAAFAGYGFPKAHAASYARVAWRSAWCKAHYPAEFIAAVLANHGGYYPQSVYLNEARRLKLVVRPPHINHSREEFSVSYPQGDPVLFMGLGQVRDLTHRAMERIMALRPFRSLEDFLIRVDPRREEAENLIQVGALDGLGAIPDLLRSLAPRRVGQLALFAEEPGSAGDWSPDQRGDAQQRLLGVALDAHPLDLFARQIAEANALSTLDAAANLGKEVRVAGMRQILRRSQTANGEWMGFLSLEDFEGMLDVVIFPQVYARSKAALSSASTPLIIDGVMEIDAQTAEPVLRAEKIARLT